MKKFLLLGAVLATSILSVNAQYGEQIGLTYYDLPSNASSPDRVVYNEDDKSVSVTWIQSITELAQPVSFDRGAGYNHYRPADGWVHGDEGACRTLNACAQEYTGWPEMINFPEETKTINGVTYSGIKREVILGHSGGLKKIARHYRSDSAWKEVEDLLIDQDYCGTGSNGLWPRAVSEGQNYIHMIATHQPSDFVAGSTAPCGQYSEVDRPFLYYRSSDQGITWDIQNYVLPGMADTSLLKSGGADAYAIAANGDVVAILAGGVGEPWVMWKSRDKGLTFEYTVIQDWDPKVYDFEDPFEDGHNARISGDGSNNVVIDDNGNVHCFTGTYLTDFDESGAFVHYSSLTTGLWYWSDKDADFCNPVFIADLVDYVDPSGTARTTPLYSDDPNWNATDNMNNNSDMSNYFAGAVSMPSATVDAAGNLYVVYSAEVEGTEYIKDQNTDPAATRDLYLVWSNDNGTTWSREINIGGELANAYPGEVGTAIEEDAYPMMPKRVGTDNMLHIVWNLDYVPGSDVQRDAGEFSQNFQYYYGINTTSDLPAMDAKTVITADPNTVKSIADVTMDSGYSYKDTILDGSYFTLMPTTSFDTIIPDTIIVAEDSLGDFFYLKDTVFCIVDSTCGTFSNNSDTTVVGSINGKDSVYVIDSVFYNIKLDTFNVNASSWSGDSTFQISSDMSGIYTVTAVYGNACPDPSTTFKVISTGTALTADIYEGDSTTICSGESVMLTGIAGGGTGVYSLTWNGNATAGDTTVMPTTTTTYYFANGSATDSFKVIVNALPATPNAGADATLDYDNASDCSQKQVASLGATAVPGLTYQWSPIVGMTEDFSTEADPNVTPTATTTYTVTVTDDNGCTASDDVTITVVGKLCETDVSVEEQLDFNISVYPNPTTDVVSVEVGNATIKAVSIYDNLGKVVKVYNANSTTLQSINTSEFEPGIYYLFVQTSKGDVTRQITVVE